MVTASERAAAEAELRDIEAEEARRSLLAFTRYTFPDYEANWHHRVIAGYLDRVLAGEILRLMLFMPPQNGKSELVSRRFPAYALGKNPGCKVIACSYSASLAQDMGRDVQRIMSAPEYGRLFPGTRLATSRDIEVRTAEKFQVVGHAGSYQATGVDGSITGKTATLGIVDDPIKNRKEADSEAYRRGVWDFYKTAFSTRQWGANVPIVITLTRWHEDDLAGRLLALAKENAEVDQWKVVSFPALAESGPNADDPRDVGDPLWPDKYPLTDLTKRRLTAGAYDWAALYQQRPAPAEGGLIKRAWWHWYRPAETPTTFREIVISWDTALRSKQTNDFASGQVWALSGPNAFALRMVHGRWDFPELIQQMADLVRWVNERWPRTIPSIVIENAGAGPEAISELRRRFSGVMAESPKGDKQQRVHAVTPLIEAGNAWLPGAALPDGQVDTTISPAWVDRFVEECAAFPFGAHDDQVDAMTQALRRLHRPKVFSSNVELVGF